MCKEHDRNLLCLPEATKFFLLREPYFGSRQLACPVVADYISPKWPHQYFDPTGSSRICHPHIKM